MADVVRPDSSMILPDDPTRDALPADDDVDLRLAAWLAAVSFETGVTPPQAPDPSPDEHDEWVH